MKYDEFLIEQKKYETKIIYGKPNYNEKICNKCSSNYTDSNGKQEFHIIRCSICKERTLVCKKCSKNKIFVCYNCFKFKSNLKQKLKIILQNLL